MIVGERLGAMLPHGGSMMLLDGLVGWDARHVRCYSRKHLDPGNPLRREGRLGAVCALEWALQAAALHGAMLAGGVAQPAGYVARLRDVALGVDTLDDEALGLLWVEARLERQEARGMLYGLKVEGALGQAVASGMASIALPA